MSLFVQNGKKGRKNAKSRGSKTVSRSSARKSLRARTAAKHGAKWFQKPAVYKAYLVEAKRVGAFSPEMLARLVKRSKSL